MASFTLKDLGVSVCVLEMSCRYVPSMLSVGTGYIYIQVTFAAEHCMALKKKKKTLPVYRGEPERRFETHREPESVWAGSIK